MQEQLIKQDKEKSYTISKQSKIIDEKDAMIKESKSENAEQQATIEGLMHKNAKLEAMMQEIMLLLDKSEIPKWNETPASQEARLRAWRLDTDTRTTTTSHQTYTEQIPRKGIILPAWLKIYS